MAEFPMHCCWRFTRTRGWVRRLSSNKSPVANRQSPAGDMLATGGRRLATDMNHFISIVDTPPETLRHLLDVSKRLKHQHKQAGRNDPLLAGKTLAMIFEKPSLRTQIGRA